jgi:pantoate--beta-alanine ligase
MKIIKEIGVFKEQRESLAGKTIGFVATMGYFHEGHLSLIDRSIAENDVTVVSIFVNPIQFGPGEDLDRYPRDFQRDKSLLEQRNVGFVFFPDSNEMYGENFYTYVQVEKLGTILCGRSRPTHFKGVTTVVLKLFNIIRPTRAYFGQKDAQQAIIIKRMCQDLNLDIGIRVCPIIRDPDGLALSSRNKYLSQRERKAALTLSRSLKNAWNLIENGWTDCARISKGIEKELMGSPLIEIDYIEIVSLDNLGSIEKIDPGNTLVAAAIKVGSTRLIDNFILGEI